MKNIILVMLLAAFTAYATTYFVGRNANLANPLRETAFKRVLRTNTLRCGYAIATPWFYIDPRSGEKKGYTYDVTMAVAEKMGLKVEWVEETGWGVAEQGLTHRYDMMCGSVCIDPKRNRAALYSLPFEHAPILPVARANDPRFDGGSAAIDNKSIRIGVKSGHIFEDIAKEKFPRAMLVYASDMSDDSEFLLMLEANKIDIAFAGKITTDLYEEKNPGKVKSLPYPARYCDGAFMLPLEEFNLKHMVDNALIELNSAGILDRIAKKHMPLDALYIRLPQTAYR